MVDLLFYLFIYSLNYWNQINLFIITGLLQLFLADPGHLESLQVEKQEGAWRYFPCIQPCLDLPGIPKTYLQIKDFNKIYLGLQLNRSNGNIGISSHFLCKILLSDTSLK